MKKSTAKWKLIIADDHALLRLGLKVLFSYQSDFEVVGEAEDGESALALVMERKPDLVIMDLMMPGLSAHETIQRMLSTSRVTPKVLLLTSYGTAAEITDCISAGAFGAILKDTPNEDLPDILRRIAAGEKVFSLEIELSMKEITGSLSPQQIKVLEKVSDGYTSNEIASAFAVSPDTVNKQLASACSKLGASNRTEAVSIALKKHLLKT